MTALPEPAVSLELLGDELDGRGLVVTLAPEPVEGRPLLEVTSRALRPARPMQILCSSGWFWLPWAERIAPVTSLRDAADRITGALGAC
jgi:hypothetical protein